MRVSDDALLAMYDRMYRVVTSVEEYKNEVGYVANLKWEEMARPDVFLREHAFVVMCSGFRASVVEKYWPRIACTWEEWSEWATVDLDDLEVETMHVFASKAKVSAIRRAAERMRRDGWETVRAAVEERGVDALCGWPYIGNVTCYHLGRNLGLDVVKPDRHLTRIAEKTGYATPMEMCQVIANATGHRIGVVDVVIWRYAAVIRDYLITVPQRPEE